MDVEARELSSKAMCDGNESLYGIVVDGDTVKEWVGIGWIELRSATEEDREKYPTVVRGRS